MSGCQHWDHCTCDEHMAECAAQMAETRQPKRAATHPSLVDLSAPSSVRELAEAMELYQGCAGSADAGDILTAWRNLRTQNTPLARTQNTPLRSGSSPSTDAVAEAFSDPVDGFDAWSQSRSTDNGGAG